MATFVDLLPEKGLESTLASYISRLEDKAAGKTTEENKEVTIDAKEPAEILRSFLGKTPLIISQSTEKELENFFFIVFDLIKKLDHESGKKVIEEAVEKLANTEPIAEKSLTRIKILVHVYNIFDENPTLRGGYFSSLLDYANRSHHADLLIPQFKDIDRRIIEWGLSSTEKQRLYKSIRNTYRNANRGKDAYDWSVRYLGTYDKDSQVTEESLKEAYETTLESIRIQRVYRYDDLVDLLPIQKLQGHSNSAYAQAHTLLQIYLRQDVKEFNRFVQSNPDALHQLVLDKEAATEKIRLLSIASIGASVASSSGQVNYSTIASGLDIQEDEVEYFVVLAITQGIVEARLDQLNRTVTVTRSLHRTFGTEEWKQLSKNLSVWNDNVKLLLKTLHDCKKANNLA
ncbi:proteasome component region PCI domain-containing protein [Planoprotostelium fungivorum]|uniref:Eukaryotic translation initiation factor 3 subunit M n=1 Tax=Planoprotostelium fungivorum TaxID=1890364 RepID=A0A2P6NDT6_9EUKA|nr:proteasome component region PCI domain-containing protein [Planoprotostelium fungivorum]